MSLKIENINVSDAGIKRMGEKEKAMLKALYGMNISTYAGIPLYILVPKLARANSYHSVIVRRIYRLQSKGLLLVEPKGIRGGKVVFFTQAGLKIAKQISSGDKI